MRIHHLNCGSMCPIGGRLTFGAPDPGIVREFVCHCLLIETDGGLVLVDTGLGLDDVREGTRRLGVGFVASCRARLLERECAVRQVEELGFKAEDVRHILVTHLDLDHAGGIPDFPGATVHAYKPEHEAAVRGGLQLPRYIKDHTRGARFELHEPEGEPWFGFECVRQIKGLPPEILIVPVVGHSAGHSAIAVDTGGGWLVHCGDAYFHRGEVRPEEGDVPFGIKLFQAVVQHRGAARRQNQARLRQLARERRDDVTLFCAHDHVEFTRALG